MTDPSSHKFVEEGNNDLNDLLDSEGWRFFRRDQTESGFWRKPILQNGFSKWGGTIFRIGSREASFPHN